MSKPVRTPTAIVVGDGLPGAQAALELAQAGVGVTLLTGADWLFPDGRGPLGIPTLIEATRHNRIKLVRRASVRKLENGSSDIQVTVRQSPCYVDAERCTACGACAQVCPIVLPGDNGAPPHKAIDRRGVPTVYALDKAGMAPCRDACPIDQRAQGYVALIRAGDFAAAYRAIKRENPFPSVCGRVCNHRCEEHCTRCQIDESVAVMALKRFVADWAYENQLTVDCKLAPRSGRRVAIVGAGPAGLTAARELNRLGHDVTVLEALPEAGGMMRVGIPAFRLPRDRLQWEIDQILQEGVQLYTNTRVEDLESLFVAGFDAAILALGLHASRQLGIPGVQESAATGLENNGAELGVMGAIEFLQAINLGTRPDWNGRQVVVVGGGSTAMDTARICRRLGAEVDVVYRRSRAEMPAHDFEIDDAQREGVRFRFLANPSQIVRHGGRVTGVTCVQMELGQPDESGRRRPIPIKDSTFTVAADTVLMAIGQDSDLSLLSDETAVVVQRGIVQHDPRSLMTARPGLFVAGDVAGTEGYVVNAIANGFQVARSVDRFLRGENGASEPVRQPTVQLDAVQVAQRLTNAAARGTHRAQAHSAAPPILLGNFQETDHGLTAPEAIAEAGRCLNCGLCSECLACVEVCPANAIDHEKQTRVFELQADALIWSSGAPEIKLHDALLRQPQITVLGASESIATAVDRTLAQFGLARPSPKTGVGAASRWRVASCHDQTCGSSYTGNHLQVGLFLCRCGGEIERVVDLSAVAARVAAAGIPGATHMSMVDFACHSAGSSAIRAEMRAHGLDYGVLAACACCALDQVCYSCTNQRTRCKERLGVWDKVGGLPLYFVNVREQCAFVHRNDPAAATRKAGDLVASAVAVTAMAAYGRPAIDLASRVAAYQVTDRHLTGLASRIPITATVDPVRCRGCEDCERVCGLDAMQVLGQNSARLAHVDATRCQGCGVCMAVCSSGAILAGDTSDAQADAALAAMGDLTDKTIIFSCNWGAYSAVEAAGVQSLAYDASTRLIRLMCAGRAHSGLILRAFAQGAKRVLVLACGHDITGVAAGADVSACYYQSDSEQAARSVGLTQQLMRLLGLDPERLALVEILPGDSAHFVAAVETLVKLDTKEVSRRR